MTEAGFYDDSSSSSHATGTTTTNDGCRVSNDPETGTLNPLSVCNRTEYWCDHVDEGGSRTIQFRYTVEYLSTLDPSHVLLYLQENILEHVAYGLNLTECRRQAPTSTGGKTRQRRLQTAAFAVTGLPPHHYLAPPECSYTTTNHLCSGTAQGGVTVWAPLRGIDQATNVTRGSIRNVMDMLREPGAIERVNFRGFVEPDDGTSASAGTAWYRNRIVLTSLVGGGFGLCLLVLMSCCCSWLCCQRRRCCHRKKQQQRQDKRNRNRQWEVLDEELPIAQRDSLALQPQRSWMMIRKTVRSSEPMVTADRSEATGDLTNDQEGQFSLDEEESEEGSDRDHSGSDRLVGVRMINSSSFPDSQVQQEPKIVGTDPYILHEVSDDDSDEVANQWRNIQSFEGGSTEEYDDEIIEVLGHLEMKSTNKSR